VPGSLLTLLESNGERPDRLRVTSALDNRTQAQVATALAGLRAARVVIAHRLSAIRHADKIIVLQEGKVAQSGSCEALMHGDGPFATLARRQLT